MEDSLRSKKAFLLFHINLSFSSIEVKDHKLLIHNCYWPLLNLISSSRLKIAIEISGSSLQKIYSIDPKWTKEFKRLISDGFVELIGSGAYQIIGPLVPYEINLHNQLFGLETYNRILNIIPKCALVNEMSFSSGVIDFYLESGFETILMERNNAALSLTDKTLRDIDQIKYLEGSNGKKIKVIWTDSILFQRFQRYVHNDISLSNYLQDLSKYHKKFFDILPIYSNDAEVFNFRPGRFSQEAKIEHDEWAKIGLLLSTLSKEGLRFYLPTEISNYKKNKKNTLINVTSSSYPAIVKKQPKYNLTRWALTGRNDIWINTICFRIFKKLPKIKNKKRKTEIQNLLCKFWSSDLRTHITEKRWNLTTDEIRSVCLDLNIDTSLQAPRLERKNRNSTQPKSLSGSITTDKNSRLLKIKTKFL